MSTDYIEAIELAANAAEQSELEERMDSHIQNQNIHTTMAEKIVWNRASAMAEEDEEVLNSHIGDSAYHVSGIDRNKWNRGVEKAGINELEIANLNDRLETKADRSELNSHTRNQDIHIREEDRANWDTVENKVDKVNGMGLSENSYTNEEKEKLAEIEDKANFYTHPDTHPAYMITEDGTRRFVSDAEKTVYQDKYTKNEIDNLFAALENDIDWKEAVDTYADIENKYPNPKDGWTVNVKDTDYTYRYSGDEWIVISANAIPKATESVDGLMSKEDKQRLTAHLSDTANPHVVTKQQIGLGNCENTSDADKPVSTAQKAYMDRFAKKLTASGKTIHLEDADNNILSTVTTQDTVYTHPTSTGYRHIPAGGSGGQMLKWSADGNAAWGALTKNEVNTALGYTAADAGALEQLNTNLVGKASTNHASTATTYGGGTASNYGHVKLSDTYASHIGTAASSIGASQTALYNAYIALNTNLETKFIVKEYTGSVSVGASTAASKEITINESGYNVIMASGGAISGAQLSTVHVTSATTVYIIMRSFATVAVDASYKIQVLLKKN